MRMIATADRDLGDGQVRTIRAREQRHLDERRTIIMVRTVPAPLPLSEAEEKYL